ncbi:hypothetical protein CDAR_209021 [Caerostris darwini]|uniref:Uncharacterized protein n=1 Tax=Caerostris darwini TaxID=1538125 RepID=A0AAV4WSD1_9ARAC|nr:hypothetical protein CDAR_209021 [Caerostris darwini]
MGKETFTDTNLPITTEMLSGWSCYRLPRKRDRILGIPVCSASSWQLPLRNDRARTTGTLPVIDKIRDKGQHLRSLPGMYRKSFYVIWCKNDTLLGVDVLALWGLWYF